MGIFDDFFLCLQKRLSSTRGQKTESRRPHFVVVVVVNFYWNIVDTMLC